MTTAFVLSGGGSLGAVQAGMLAAIEEQGLRPDLLIGTSAGALNAAYLGAHGYSAESIADLAELWRGLRRQDVFPLDPLRSMLAFAGKRASLCSMRPLRRLVETHLPIDDLRDAQLPLHIIATDALSGEEVALVLVVVAEADRFAARDCELQRDLHRVDCVANALVNSQILY